MSDGGNVIYAHQISADGFMVLDVLDEFPRGEIVSMTDRFPSMKRPSGLPLEVFRGTFKVVVPDDPEIREFECGKHLGDLLVQCVGKRVRIDRRGDGIKTKYRVFVLGEDDKVQEVFPSPVSEVNAHSTRIGKCDQCGIEVVVKLDGMEDSVAERCRDCGGDYHSAPDAISQDVESYQVVMRCVGCDLKIRVDYGAGSPNEYRRAECAPCEYPLIVTHLRYRLVDTSHPDHGKIWEKEAYLTAYGDIRLGKDHS